MFVNLFLYTCRFLCISFKCIPFAFLYYKNNSNLILTFFFNSTILFVFQQWSTKYLTVKSLFSRGLYKHVKVNADDHKVYPVLWLI